MEMEWTPITTADDITPELLAVVETVFEGYYADEPRIDWQQFLSRVEQYGHCDLGSSMDSPAIMAIRKYVKKIRAEG
jgi:isocitrate dehydrogenase